MDQGSSDSDSYQCLLLNPCDAEAVDMWNAFESMSKDGLIGALARIIVVRCRGRGRSKKTGDVGNKLHALSSCPKAQRSVTDADRRSKACHLIRTSDDEAIAF